ncbi:CopY family transcriptional regulator [Mycolicibacterium wolinskyi]|uniref:CopY family transcriptional regulator n=2 Tax=Mycolicibacterium wolinskyi TaxID=59750 RepID=A0A132PDW2_9MYCO|nr:CopY family transcriptional regulator [Mycolicibacterium wolinskyi]
MRSFGELEAAIMGVAWAAADAVTVRDVVEALRDTRNPAYTTVQTVMDILHTKGWLDRDKRGRAYRYHPTATQQEYAARLIGDVLAETPHRAGVLAKFVTELDPDELDELRVALRKAKAKRGAS